MLQVENVFKSYGSFEALKGISFELGKGEVVGFLGPNGAGKTTTMRILTGYLPPTSGNCLLNGVSIHKEPLHAHKKMGYLPESNALYTDQTVLDYLRYIAELRQIDSINQSLGYAADICSLKSVLTQKIGTLSKGYRQRVGLAQALLHKPDFLVLDEPTVGLDPNQIIEIRQLIKTIGKEHTVLLSSHILPEIEQTCERVLIINSGTIVAQGSPQELMNQAGKTPVFQIALRNHRETVEEKLRSTPEIAHYHFLEEQSGRQKIQITLRNVDQGGEFLFGLASRNNWILSELKPEEVSLESVFKELTH